MVTLGPGLAVCGHSHLGQNFTSSFCPPLQTFNLFCCCCLCFFLPYPCYFIQLLCIFVTHIPFSLFKSCAFLFWFVPPLSLLFCPSLMHFVFVCSNFIPFILSKLCALTVVKYSCTLLLPNTLFPLPLSHNALMFC